MKVKIFFILGLSFLFFSFHVARASVVINEVELSPVGERFIELYNADSAPINLTNYYIQRKTASGSSFSSLVTSTNFENKTINSNGYFVISRTQLPNSNIVIPDLTLTDSNTIQIKDGDGNIVDKIGWGTSTDCTGTCPQNPTEGKSLQKTSSGWVVATPTMGTANESSTDANSSTNTATNSGGGSSAPSVSVIETKTKVVEIPKIKTKIMAKSLAYVGIPFELEASTTGLSNEIRNYGKYFWNFGDGDSKEVNLNQNKKFSHIYYYPGEYQISLEYYSNYFGDIPDTINTFTLKVISATVSISRIGDEKDFFIELSNDSDYDIDISKWILSSNAKTFILPKNTNINAKSKIILSPKVTNFVFTDKDNLKLLEPNWEVAFEYGASKNIGKSNITRVVSISDNTKIKDEINTNIKEIKIDPEVKLEENSVQNIDSNSLGAAPILSDEGNKNKSYFFFWVFVVLLLVSGGVVYYIRQGKNVQEVGDDFKIIDE